MRTTLAVVPVMLPTLPMECVQVSCPRGLHTPRPEGRRICGGWGRDDCTVPVEGMSAIAVSSMHVQFTTQLLRHVDTFGILALSS